MTKNDYIEKITQNLEHLTKDELKDVATLTNVQFGVRLKVAEKEYWEKEVEAIKSKLQHKALPVVPSFVAEWIEILKTKGLKPLKNPETYGETGFTEEKLQNIVFWISEHQEDYMRAWLDDYTVEEPQLFYLKNKITKAFLYDNGLEFGECYENCKDWEIFKTKFTKQEIDSMQTGSYELVPVEDKE